MQAAASISSALFGQGCSAPEGRLKNRPAGCNPAPHGSYSFHIGSEMPDDLRRSETDPVGKERVQGDPRGPGGSAPQLMQDSQFRENLAANRLPHKKPGSSAKRPAHPRISRIKSLPALLPVTVSDKAPSNSPRLGPTPHGCPAQQSHPVPGPRCCRPAARSKRDGKSG